MSLYIYKFMYSQHLKNMEQNMRKEAWEDILFNTAKHTYFIKRFYYYMT